MNLLFYNIKWSEISKLFKLLKILDIFIWIMDIIIKYIVLLGEYFINLLYVLKFRLIGIMFNKYNFLIGIMGNLFIKFYKMSEEMFNVMECRGFIGEYIVKINFKFNKSDYIYCVINIMLIILFLYL